MKKNLNIVCHDANSQLSQVYVSIHLILKIYKKCDTFVFGVVPHLQETKKRSQIKLILFPAIEKKNLLLNKIIYFETKSKNKNSIRRSHENSC